MKRGFSEYYNIIFFSYSLDAALFFSIDNKYFTAFSLAVDILFVYFIAKLLLIEEMVIFSVVPLFFSCIFLECFLAVALLLLSFVVVLFYSDLNMTFAIISYIAAFFSSYLVKQSIKQRELIKKKEAFKREFDDRIFIAKRMSLEFAHEIRNPLMGISGAIEILKQAKDEGTRQEMINIAQQEIERANNLTRDFLNLEKPYRLNQKQFDLCVFLREFAKDKRSMVNIDTYCKDNKIDIKADMEMLTRMLDNFIRNSIEAGASKINVEACTDNDNVVVIIEDNGKGINIDGDGERIFMPFFTTKEQGSGLGLAICKQIAESHNGYIEIYNKNAFKIKLSRE